MEGTGQKQKKEKKKTSCKTTNHAPDLGSTEKLLAAAPHPIATIIRTKYVARNPQVTVAFLSAKAMSLLLFFVCCELFDSIELVAQEFGGECHWVRCVWLGSAFEKPNRKFFPSL